MIAEVSALTVLVGDSLKEHSVRSAIAQPTTIAPPVTNVTLQSGLA